MVFCYTTYDSVNNKKVTIWLDGHSGESLIRNWSLGEENENNHALTISGLRLIVRKPIDTIVEWYVNYNSALMLESICEISTEVCSKLHDLDPFVPIHLLMDNAGWHGTKVAKEEYTEILKSEFNIIVQWQLLNSPELTLLDLGA